jgi:hypothetical protein
LKIPPFDKLRAVSKVEPLGKKDFAFIRHSSSVINHCFYFLSLGFSGGRRTVDCGRFFIRYSSSIIRHYFFEIFLAFSHF